MKYTITFETDKYRIIWALNALATIMDENADWSRLGEDFVDSLNYLATKVGERLNQPDDRFVALRFLCLNEGVRDRPAWNLLASQYARFNQIIYDAALYKLGAILEREHRDWQGGIGRLSGIFNAFLSKSNYGLGSLSATTEIPLSDLRDLQWGKSQDPEIFLAAMRILAPKLYQGYMDSASGAARF